MAGSRMPLEVIEARGAKHLTKAERQKRLESEIKPIVDNIVAPDYLSKKQKNEFYRISEQLKKLKIMGETDVDTLARYIVAQDFYINAVKKKMLKMILFCLENGQKFKSDISSNAAPQLMI